ncbi:F0F1 ATP synthase subunit delta [Propionivibrio sp.]|uniref:F0F1 ATP synthase subunit delta n=1 Tax=Propionivibrio sp. TaxID=2212460 RepID=UPI003BF247D3
MELDWTTFGLEIVNFLALIWILKRFLYRPVLATLAERRAGIERSLNEARETQAGAATLKSEFEGRLADWSQEKAAARTRFEAELAAERARQMEALTKELAAERERSAAQDAHRQEALKREVVAQAGTEARQFASVLLGKLAGPDLEARLVDLFVEELAALPEERLAPLQTGQNSHGTGITAGIVTSAYPLAEAQRQLLSNAIEARLGRHEPLAFVEDSTLLAGIRLSLGAWQLDFSLAGELGVFAEASHLAQ